MHIPSCCARGLLALFLASAPAPRALAALDVVFANSFDDSGPISADEFAWTWIPFEGSTCANGVATGIGVNLSSLSDRVLIYLAGGGACWDEQTCYTLDTAAFIETGFGPTEFAAAVSQALDTSFFDRTVLDNPFRDMSFVFVPYCTGDVHTGDNAIAYGTHLTLHKGYANLTAYLSRLVPSFRASTRVYLAGSSGGGYGASFNWFRTQAAFGTTRVDMIDDAGTTMPATIVPPSNTNDTKRRTNWNIAATLPAGCTGCATTLENIYAFNNAQLPNNRGTLLSYTTDNVLPTFYGISSASFTSGLHQVESAYFDPINPNFKYFELAATGHVLFGNPALSQNGVTLKTFLTLMLSDSPGWATVEPP